ncbi:MAG: hypothetical protein GW789_09375 [Ignavibacteria bacterium]|nr:hypothetical protein [Ignavibacteria bacterium]
MIVFHLSDIKTSHTFRVFPLIKRTLNANRIIYPNEYSRSSTIIDPLLYSNGEFSTKVEIN